MICCRRRRSSTAVAIPLGIDAEIHAWFAAAQVEDSQYEVAEGTHHEGHNTTQVEVATDDNMPESSISPPEVAPIVPCPICFDVEGDKVAYVQVSTHSWENSDRCDGHAICRPCLQRHVEIKLVDEAVWNIRCPGEACPYRLLQQDLEMALEKSQFRAEALAKHRSLRSEDCGSRLREVLSQESTEEWLWNECQVCPTCFVLARREDGCDHLACRCGTHFCWRCGADYDCEGTPCCCNEFELHQVQRSFLCCWLCFKHDNHPALGDLKIQVRDKLTVALPSTGRRAERLRAAAERARLEDEAEEEWARNEVTGTADALELRSRLESLGLHFWQAGVNVQVPMPEVHESFQGLLVNSTADARENNDDDWDLEQWSALAEFEYEEPEPRRARIDPRRVVRVKAWLATEGGTGRKTKATAEAPAQPRRQKHAIVASSRRQTAQARDLRMARSMRSVRLQVYRD